jgi:tol-pal system protein YbgF
MGRPNRVRELVTWPLLAVFLLTACALQERDVVTEHGNRINDLQAQVRRLERSLEEAWAAPAAPAAPTAPSQPSDLRQRLADLGQQVEALTVTLRDINGRVDRLETVSNRGSADAPRITKLESRVAVLSDQVATFASRTAAPTTAAGKTAPAGQAATPPKTAARKDPSPQTIYDEAYSLYKQGKYVQAREAFKEYVGLYPDTKLTDNAHFWIGESYYDQGQYEQAILEYDKVVQEFPNGDKVASALLKQAFAFDAIGGPQDAKILLKKILRDHPSSEQAAIARKKLEILGE